MCKIRHSGEGIVSGESHMDRMETEAMIETAIAKSRMALPWNFDRVIDAIKTLGFPLVMCGLMSWAFYDVGRMVFDEHIQATRKTTLAVEAAFRKHDEALSRIDKSLERHADAIERVSKRLP